MAMCHYTLVKRDPSVICPGELSPTTAQRLAECFGVDAFLDDETGFWWAFADHEDDDTSILGDESIRLTPFLAKAVSDFTLN